MTSPTMLIFLLGFLFGMMVGMYFGNKKLRRAVNGMLRPKEDDDWDDEDYDD